MGRESRILVLALAVVVVGGAVLWLATRTEPEATLIVPEEDGPVRFHFTDVPVDSADLEIGPAEIKGAIFQTYISWRVTMECAEPEGCNGEFALEVIYRKGSETGRIGIINRSQVAIGHDVSFDGLQEPSTAVDGIDRLSLRVLDRQQAVEGPIDIPL